MINGEIRVPTPEEDRANYINALSVIAEVSILVHEPTPDEELSEIIAIEERKLAFLRHAYPKSNKKLLQRFVTREQPDDAYLLDDE